MLHLTISQGDGLPMYAQLIQQIKALIASGRLSADEELPSVRQLANQLVLNPNTIVRAYRELESDGLIYKKRGAGTFVSSNATPYTDEVCRRMLGERMDPLIVEALNLGYTLKQITELLSERWTAFQSNTATEEQGN